MNSTLILFAATLLTADITAPKVLDDRLQLQLVAAEPQIVTPTGIAVDERGRVLVIECHTHFPPQNYAGPKADRILLMDDLDPATGQARQISTFFEGTTHTMNLAVYRDGSVYVATRAEIFRLRDKDGDGKSDERTPICRLETAGNYPHNGLSGFAFDFAGNVYFGFGENLGADYKLIGSDGKELKGGGEGGNIYACDPEGKNLRRVATGFWNPFHVCFDAFGRLFAVDNDPDSRPPCRLLHIVEGGDYGYRFRNGRKGVHPFTSWNGELPGTLPMVAGTGEAPSGILAYESDNLPSDYIGDLLVTSWGDHRLERYRLTPRGASFSGEMTPVLRGDQNFRPVGIALAPDGSLLLSDWVDKSYQLHGKGRVWRLSAKNPPKPNRPSETLTALSSPHGPWREAAARKLSNEEAQRVVRDSPSPRARVVAARSSFRAPFDMESWCALLAAEHPMKVTKFWNDLDALGGLAENGKVRINLKKANELFDARGQSPEIRAAALRAGIFLALPFEEMSSNDPFLIQAAVRNGVQFAESGEGFEKATVPVDDGKPTVQTDVWKHENRWAWALVLREFESAVFDEYVPPAMLADDDPRIQMIGLRWIAEERDHRHRKSVESLIVHAKSRQVFEAALAALDILDRGPVSDPKSESAGDEYVAKLLKDAGTSREVRRFALRTLRPDHPQFTIELLTSLLTDADASIRLEAIRTIRQRPDAERWPQLRGIAADEKASQQERCEAILGLSPGNRDDRRQLLELAANPVPEVSDEALRALRGFDLTAEEKDHLTGLAAKLAPASKELAERALARNPPKDLPKPEDQAAWLKLATGEGDPQAGERIFFHLRVGGCFRCHEHEGRGYKIGPDLSTIGRSMTRERLVQSIVDPSREIAPQFTNWSILTLDGEVKTGIHIGDEVDGRMKYADQNGRVFHVHPNDVDQRKPGSQSVMPAGLADNLTAQELRDLLAFLTKGE